MALDRRDLRTTWLDVLAHPVSIAVVLIAVLAVGVIVGVILLSRVRRPAEVVLTPEAGIWKALVEEPGPVLILHDSPLFPDSPIERILSGTPQAQDTVGEGLALQTLMAWTHRFGLTPHVSPTLPGAWDPGTKQKVILLGTRISAEALSAPPLDVDFQQNAEGYLVNRKPLPGEQTLYSVTRQTGAPRPGYAVVGLFRRPAPNGAVAFITGTGNAEILAAVDWVTNDDSMRQMSDRIIDASSIQVLLRVIPIANSRHRVDYVTHHLSR